MDFIPKNMKFMNSCISHKRCTKVQLMYMMTLLCVCVYVKKSILSRVDFKNVNEAHVFAHVHVIIYQCS